MSAPKVYVKLDMYVQFSGGKIYSFDENYMVIGKVCAKYHIS